MGIYVEIAIRGDINDLWEKTQNPKLHERWDIRFSSIDYLPRTDESDRQRFHYSTRIGFGLRVYGKGETVAHRDDAHGRRTSSLRFWSDDPKSLIRAGSGYWQYQTSDNELRFVTGYDYRTRFGPLGWIVDRMVFRPLIGWGTAWSFDRLRLWIEKGIDPAISLQRSLIHLLCKVAIGMVWIYQGVVPKLIGRNADELAMLSDAGVPAESLHEALTTVGCAEALLGLATLFFIRFRWPFVMTIILMGFASLGVSLNSPRYLTAAFNPVCLNLLVAVVSVIGLLVLRDLPSARTCLRSRLETDS